MLALRPGQEHIVARMKVVIYLATMGAFAVVYMLAKFGIDSYIATTSRARLHAAIETARVYADSGVKGYELVREINAMALTPNASPFIIGGAVVFLVMYFGFRVPLSVRIVQEPTMKHATE